MWFSPRTPRILAHRGLARDAVENTCEAFAAALDAGAPYIESDVHATADGVAVLFHDDDLSRDFGNPGVIEQLSLAELRDLTEHRAHIPTLEEALSAFPDARWNLDIKTSAAIAPAIDVISRAGASERVLLASFSGSRSGRVARALPDAARSPGIGRMVVVLLCARLGLVRCGRIVLRRFHALQLPVRMAGQRLISRRLVARYHAMGVEVHVWTINDPAEMRALRSIGIDGTVTDRADLAVTVFFGDHT